MLLKYNGCRSERHSNSLDNTSCGISSQTTFILNDDVSIHENFANINLTKLNIMNCNSSETSDNLHLKSFEHDDSLFSDNATFEAHLSNLTLDADDTSTNNKVSLHLQDDIMKYSTDNNFSHQVPTVVNLETEALDIYNCLPPITTVQTSKAVDDSLSVLENNLSAADVASELEEFCLMKHNKESNYSGNATTNITVIEGIDDDSSNDCDEDLLEDLPPGVILSCSDCGYITPSKVEMEAHSCQEELGQQPKFHCTDCNKSFSRQDSLQIHSLIHAEKPWSCRQCEQSFESRDTLSVHEIEKHSDSRSWLCDLCGKIFPHVMQLRIHRRAHVEVAQQMRRFRCEKCPRLFRNRFLLRTHMQEHNTEKPVMCEVCGLTFSDQKTLEQHSSFHNDAKAFECGICSLVFERKVGLTKHYKLHSEENIVACRICKATFPSVAGLLNHRKTHTPEEWESARQQCKTVPHSSRPQQYKSVPHTTSQPPSPKSYRCSRCSKLLSSKLSLSLHMRVHTGEKPFECLICNKRFTQKPALTYHMRLHTGERPHTCQFCGKGFNSKVGKESHERIHTGERPYRCGQCGVGFRCSANLRQHTWIHTDSRPFTCEICCKPFRRREALQVHMRTHTGERPYSCPLCGRCFTQKGDMLKHTRSHDRPGRGTVTPAAACSTCGQTFAQRKHFKAHRCLLGGPKNENDEVTIAASDVISFPEITVVSNDMQDFEVNMNIQNCDFPQNIFSIFNYN